jgi:hypothetical protein
LDHEPRAKLVRDWSLVVGFRSSPPRTWAERNEDAVASDDEDTLVASGRYGGVAGEAAEGGQDGAARPGEEAGQTLTLAPSAP